MKKSYLIGLVVIAIAVTMIISTIGDASTYVSFGEAKEMASNGNKNAIHVVGELVKGPDGKPAGMIYEPSVDPNHFEFLMTDSLNNQAKVVYNQPKPQDMDKSEKVVVVGHMDLQKNQFEAEQILLKCPSKYNNTGLVAEETK
ncbi:MAG: cytochrome c maturation protein CcmE [Spirosomataceae bacterium]|jgi:cytochrome c-type biogenesis protein CcmE